MVEVVARFLQGVEIFRWGLLTNWWGLGCPSHCGSPAASSLLLCLILGFFLGFALCLFICYFVLGAFLRDLPAPQRGPPPASWQEAHIHRLRGYLHARVQDRQPQR